MCYNARTMDESDENTSYRELKPYDCRVNAWFTSLDRHIIARQSLDGVSRKDMFDIFDDLAMRKNIAF